MRLMFQERWVLVKGSRTGLFYMVISMTRHQEDGCDLEGGK
jgi:hypothetical protein